MKNKNIVEIGMPVVLIVLAIAFLNPFNFWMPSMLVSFLLLVMVIIFGVFASFILKEHARDEREEVHRAIAGRGAFLFGMSITLLGIVLQELQHKLDPWLVIIFVGMIVAKVVSLVYIQKRR